MRIHVWRNLEVPAALNRITPKAVADPPALQIFSYVDGEPFIIADPDGLFTGLHRRANIAFISDCRCAATLRR